MTQLEMRETLDSITTHITKLRKLFKRVEMLELFEEKVMSGEDKMSGRNRLSLSYGKN